MSANTATATAGTTLTPCPEEVGEFYDAIWGPHEWPAGAVITITAARASGSFGLVGTVRLDREDARERFVSRVMAHATDPAIDGLYAGIAPLRHKPTSGRGTADDTDSIPALLLDVDTADGAHQPGERPHPDRDQARAFINRAPWGPPSTVVDTGGGYHAYWGLAEPALTGDTTDPEAAETRALMARWEAWWQAAAREAGIHLDGGVTVSPARVMRIPGTVNRRSDRVAVITETTGCQYLLDDVAPYLPERTARATDRPATEVGEPGTGDRPGDRLARTQGALDLMLEDRGLIRARGSDDRWVYPRADGSHSTSDSHAQVHHDDDGAYRVAIHGGRMRADWDIDIGAMSAWDLLGHLYCGGDWKLAARIAHAHDGDAAGLVAAISGKTAVDLRAEYPPRATTDVTDAPTPTADQVAAMVGMDTEDTDDSPTPTVIAVPDPAVCAQTVHLARTELGAAERWVAHWGSGWRWTGEHWLRWDGRLWAEAEAGQWEQTFFAMARAVAGHEADHVTVARRPDEDDESYAARVHAAQQAHRAWAEKLERAAVCRAVETIAASLPGIYLAPEQFDAGDDPDLLNTPAGVWDMAAGELLPHDPGLYMTRITAGSGNIDAPLTPVIEETLERFAETDERVPDMLRAVAAVAVTGYTERILAHLWGQAGGTGKSTFCEALVTALGDYGGTLQGKHLAHQPGRSGDTPDPSLVAVSRARAIFIDELANVTLDVDRLKSISAGQRVPIRTMHSRDIIEVRWQATMMMTGQERVRISADDGGMTARIHPVEIGENSVIKAQSQSVGREAQSQASLDGLLAWAIRAAIEWRKRGSSRTDLQMPAGYVDEQRARYLEAVADPVADWWDEAVTEVAASPADPMAPTTTEMYESYARWCRRMGMVRGQVSLHRFVALVEARGYRRTGKTTRTRPAHRDRVIRGRFVPGVRLEDHEYKTKFEEF